MRDSLVWFESALAQPSAPVDGGQALAGPHRLPVLRPQQAMEPRPPWIMVAWFLFLVASLPLGAGGLLLDAESRRAPQLKEVRPWRATCSLIELQPDFDSVGPVVTATERKPAASSLPLAKAAAVAPPQRLAAAWRSLLTRGAPHAPPAERR